MQNALIIFKSAGILSLLTGTLALLIVIARKYLADYGVCKILINKEKELEVQGGGTLLSALTDNGIFIPSACGGKATCGYCRLSVVSGAGPVLPTEEPYLTGEDRAENVRLSCCVKVRNDLEIEIPPEILSLREYMTRVERIRDLTYDVKELRLALPGDGLLAFKAGQYVQIKAPVYEKSPLEVYRAYSLSSAPTDSRAAEFVIRRVPEGICTTYIFDYLNEGDTLAINGPYGDFTLSDTGADIIFIAGSTGIAPVKSILHQMVEQSIQRKAVFFFGALAMRDMFYLDEMRAFQEKLPNFRFVPALSEKTEADAWDGETGLITEIVDRHVEPDSGAEAYLCGSPGMIDAAIAVLKTKGITEDRIFFDKFA